MNILVTGSTGFVGRNLLPMLIDKGHNIIEVTVEPEQSVKLYGDKTNKIPVSSNQEKFTDNIKRCNPEIVIHLASYLTASDDYNSLIKLLDANTYFLGRLLDSLKSTNVKLFINTGTFAEYFKGDGIFEPAYLYAATKTASRFLLKYYSKTYNFNHGTVTPYTIYGGKDSQKKLIDLIIDSLDSEVALDLSPGEQILDFIHVRDVAGFFVHLVENYNSVSNGDNYMLGTGKGTSIKQLVKLIEDQSGKKANINWGGKPYRKNDLLYAVADPKSFSELNWVSKITLSEGIQMLVNK